MGDFSPNPGSRAGHGNGSSWWSRALDIAFGSTVGGVLVRKVFGWESLPVGSINTVLTVGSLSNVGWASTATTGITQLTGDVTAGPGTGSKAATLATVNSSPGSYTNASLTVNSKGLVTAASSGAAQYITSVDSNFTVTSGTLELASISAGYVLGNSGSSSAEPAGTAISSFYKVPQRTVYTSSSGTYTVPSGALYLKIRMVGGGAGGGGGNNGTAGTSGGNTTFGSSFLTASGGQGGADSGGSVAGAGQATGGDVNVYGGPGQAGTNVVNLQAPGTGGGGGDSPFGGGGGGGCATTGGNAFQNSGAGGGGGGLNNSVPFGITSGSGGQAGGYVEKLITSPSSTYSYGVGAGGAGAAAGSVTAGTSFAGGNGGNGMIIIDAHFQ